jgi:hypothetical protein
MMFPAASPTNAAGNIIGEVWMNDFQWVLFGSLLAVTSQPHLSRGFLKRPVVDRGSGAKPSEQTQVIA